MGVFWQRRISLIGPPRQKLIFQEPGKCKWHFAGRVGTAARPGNWKNLRNRRNSNLTNYYLSAVYKTTSVRMRSAYTAKLASTFNSNFAISRSVFSRVNSQGKNFKISKFYISPIYKTAEKIVSDVCLIYITKFNISRLFGSRTFCKTKRNRI